MNALTKAFSKLLNDTNRGEINVLEYAKDLASGDYVVKVETEDGTLEIFKVKVEYAGISNSPDGSNFDVFNPPEPKLSYDFSEKEIFGDPTFTYLYVKGAYYPCGYYQLINGLFRAISYIYPLGHGMPSNKIERSFNSTQVAQEWLVEKMKANVKEFYPNLL